MTTGYRAPSWALLATEAPRAGLDFAALLATWPLLATARRGDGHPVLVLPGLLAGDPATVLLRNFLRALGHKRLGLEPWHESRSQHPRGPGTALGSNGSTTTPDGG